MTSENSSLEQEERETDSVAPEVSPDEKMLPQSKVNKLIGEAKAEAREKARRELMQEYEAQAQEPVQTPEPTQAQAPIQPQQMQPQAPQQDVAEIERMVREQFLKEQEAAQRAADEQRQKEEQERYTIEVNRLADQYFKKMSEGEAKYQDFSEITKAVNPAKFKEVVLLASELDNTADVMYELAQNPRDLAMISFYAQNDNVEMAQQLLNQLDKSVTRNAQGSKIHRPAAPPLDSLRPSPGTGVDGSSEMSIADLKRKYRT